MNAARWRPLTEGAAILVPLALLAAVTAPAAPVASIVFVLLACLVVFAFRDPERAVSPVEGIVLAPADGRVLRVGPVFDEHWQREMIEVAIFLALWNVHVQRWALSGRLVAQQRKAGGYRPAMTEAATHGNNQFAHYLETAYGPCTLTQISGLVARRIVSWAAPPAEVAQGARLGMIKFGSQVTLRLPVTADVLVRAGDLVEAGTTPVARLASIPTD